MRARWAVDGAACLAMALLLSGGGSAHAQADTMIEAADPSAALDRALAPLRPAMDACIFPEDGSEPSVPGTAIFVWQVDEYGQMTSDTRVTPANAQMEACLQAVAVRADLTSLEPSTRVETRLDFDPGAIQREREVYDLETGEAVAIDIRAGLGRDWDRAPQVAPAEVMEGPADAEGSRMDIERVIEAATPFIMPCFDEGRSIEAPSVTVAISVEVAGPPSVVEARGPHADTDAARCVVRRLSETLFDAPRAGGLDAYWTFSAPRFELDSAE